MKPTIKQFKLTNDDEIIGEVLEWDSDENSAIIMRGVLRLVESQDFQRGIRFFGFRPWMCFNDDPAELQTLNAAHIIAETNPQDRLRDLYMETVANIKKAVSKKPPKKDVNVQELEDAINNLTDEELDEYLEHNLVNDEQIFDPDFAHDSSNSNVVMFKPKGPKTFH